MARPRPPRSPANRRASGGPQSDARYLARGDPGRSGSGLHVGCDATNCLWWRGACSSLAQMWLAHALTVSRIPLAVLFSLTYPAGRSGGDRGWSLALVVLAALTDAAD